MEYTFAQYQESAQALRDRLGAFRPRCLLILGSGLGSLGNEVESPIAVPYEDVPHMKRSTAPDHAGRFVFGRLAGQDVAVMQGRLHTYEGWSFEDVSYPVRVLRLLGAETLVVTNAAGAVNTAFSAGDIMLITDHIKLFGVSPLCGPNLEEFGPRFPDVSHVYTPGDSRTPPGRPRRSCPSPCGRASICTSPAPSTRRRRRSGCRPGAGRGRRGHVHGAGGHCGRPLRHGGAGLHALHQYGRRGAGPASFLRRGACRRRGGGAPVLCPGKGVSGPVINGSGRP